jgi:hypothetical protein
MPAPRPARSKRTDPHSFQESPMLGRVSIAAVFLALAHTAPAQTCSQSGQILLKNDNLPDVPGTATVSVIPGLCEGEAMGCVFDVSNQTVFSNEVKVAMCAGAYINVANTNGIAAVVDLEIYDGITWNGNVPTFGPRVFEFESAAGANVQFNSSGINTLDISSFNVTVTSGKLVVVWEMLINTAPGSCATGYQTNFATDNYLPACSAPCTPVKKNLIYIQGQGWRDPMTATISGNPLCSCYYAGNWIIRACVEPVGYPRTYCTGKLNSENCIATMGWSGSATLSGPDDFHVTCSNVVAQKNGILFWGTQTAALPFFAGTLCIAQPVVRTPVQSSGGSAACSGVYDFHFDHAYMGFFGWQANDLRHVQAWYRDPQALDGTNVGLSNAVTFKVLP